jgi:hypothetical protein
MRWSLLVEAFFMATPPPAIAPIVSRPASGPASSERASFPAMADPAPLSLLSAMITPAVLISASGMLILSTATRLARIVDRVRTLARQIEETGPQNGELQAERRAELERQIATHTTRGRLIQSSLTSLYVSLALFVACTVAIPLVVLTGALGFLPVALGILGTLALFLGTLFLIRETGMALGSIREEMAFARRVADRGRAAAPPS